jgi:hypothetical protein
MHMARRSRRFSAFLRAVSLLLISSTWAAGPHSTDRANAYELHGFRWSASVIGYSTTDVRVETYVTRSISLWQSAGRLSFAAGDSGIQVVVGPLLSPIDYPNQPAQANVSRSGPWITGCEVRLDPLHFFALSETARQGVVTHELGHCLGLAHSGEPGIMKSPYLYDFGDDDVRAVQALYPPAEPLRLNLAYRSIVGGIAQDH